jgi:biotin-(acetyl-CoA carboxylase) ligase
MKGNEIMTKYTQNIQECLNRFNSKHEALKELIEVMAKHNLHFETNITYGDNGEECELKIMQDYFEDGDPIILFSKNDGKSTSIDYVEISRS